jgi:integrase
MPQHHKGPRLWAQPSFKGTDGRKREGVWVIRDGAAKRSTGIRVTNRRKAPPEAEQALADYIAEKYRPSRERGRGATAIPVADVINIYLTDKAPTQARPEEVAQRAIPLLKFWTGKTLADVNGRNCRAYVTWRAKKVARRELEDLRAAIKYHRAEGLCNEIVEVVLPERSPPRERWLTRSEAARLIWAAWRYRETQKGHMTGRYSRRHVARFVLVALYTGSRAGAVCGATLMPGTGSGWIDLERGVFYRRAAGEVETKKRRPPVRLPDRLLAHLTRWRKQGQLYAVEWNGKPIGTDLEKAFRRACEDAGLEGVTPHTLRHTAATWLMQRGTDLWEAAGFLGMTVETLEKTYGHHHADFQKQAADNIVRKA